ncbi:putative Gamma-glutamylputrescine oxidoreductase [Glarea lozoyensis 74030]|uniref:Putative Gamma-glutamylputrescine oxidoreductase n=1 Tax=Glarea lozoyensis (strain ATCC 74030 / MF5533) TaxID=1104152 RepID=H0EY35_GLAL7|nr:putative Gamma-glutamylputrescine oxidoreductase [Glarea lozoyensis 74030]
MGSINPHQIPPSPLPSKTSTTPFWRASLHALDNHRTTPSLPQTCDILIIGGGYAGIAAAYHLLASPEAKAKFASGAPKPNVVLLEARGACSGATGRNGGHLRPSVHTRLPMLIEEFGLEKAVELCEFEDAHVSAIEEVVEREGIECEFRVTRSFDVYTDEEEAGRAKETYLRLKGEGVAKSTMEGLVWMEGEEAEKKLF